MMKSKQQIIPRESALQLYKQLVKEDERTNSKYQIREYKRSSEREVMRVLEILSLLPIASMEDESENDTNTTSTIPTSLQNKEKKNQTTAPPQVSMTQVEQQKKIVLASSPYKTKRSPKKKDFSKCSSSSSFSTTTIKTSTALREGTRKDKRLRKNDEYIWHPITIKTGEGEKKKEKIVQDVMKYYSNQFHRNVPDQSCVIIKKK
mmetsp:Transcript_11163/g.20902  ORF Transcript_11163/g.20902 Transcript_11163/m.20902 type:complete len:205 (+) Transcript_11163:151-765(+)